MRISALFAVAAAGLAFGTSAHGELIATYGFTDLRATYAGTIAGGTFTAAAANAPGFLSSGDVTRTIPTEGTATYNAGFFGAGSLGNYRLELAVTGITPGVVSFANGAGTMLIVDADGDTITADVNGFFVKATGDTSFNGVLSNVRFNALTDGIFEGPDGGSFDMAFPGGPIFDGNIIELNMDPSGFFATSFEVSAQVNGEIVPAPASLALLGLGGLAARRRRR